MRKASRLQKLIFCRPEMSYDHGWVDEESKNRKKIFLSVLHHRAILADDEERIAELENEIINEGFTVKEIEIQGLDYDKLAQYDPDKEYRMNEQGEWQMIEEPDDKDKDGNRSGKFIIFDEFAIQLVQQKKILGVPPLTLSISEMLLDLSENDIFPSVCLGEIALVNFVKFEMLNSISNENPKEYEAFITEIRSRLPSNVISIDIEWMIRKLSINTLSLYRKVIIIRHALKNQGENDEVQKPTSGYIGDCEKVARIIIGDELFNAHVEPIIMNAFCLLRTLPYFDYCQNGYTSLVGGLELKLYDEFLVFVVKPYMDIRRQNKQPLTRSEIKQEFQWGTIIAIIDRCGQPIIRNMEIAFIPRYIPKSLPIPALAEVSSCEILSHISTPRRSWHNCYYQKSKKGYTFLGCSPQGVADAGANYDDGYGTQFSITIEVSIATDKSKEIKRRKNTISILGKLHESKDKTTVGYNDLLAALDHSIIAASFEDNSIRNDEQTVHITDLIERADKATFIASEIEKAAKKDREDLTDTERALYSCNPKYSFVLQKEFPHHKDSVELILDAAVHINESTLIPITFRQMAVFMYALTGLFRKNPHEITLKEWFGVLRGIENELALLYDKYHDKSKRTNEDKKIIQNLNDGNIDGLTTFLFSEEKLYRYCKGKARPADGDSSDGSDDGHEEVEHEDSDGHESDDNGE